jgi:triosephosphate isomerase
VLVAPPFLYLDWLLRELKSPLLVSAQTVSSHKNGAFTGEVSAEQLHDFGVHWTLIGHSERRHLFHASDEEVKKQIEQALQHKLSIIACVGETEEERKADKTMAVISQQLTAIAAAVPSPAAWLSSLVLAYEPVWAIGTGQTATAQQAQEVHAAIRRWLQQHVSEDVSAGVRVIYGGSVQSKNAVDLIRQPDVDGFLVGGASLKDEFGDIVAATKQANKAANRK